MVKLPLSLTHAVALYYLNRDKQYITPTRDKDGMAISYRSTFKWDKQTDLKAIRKACRTKWGVAASAGTFWFTRIGRKTTYRVDESTFPLAIKERS